ncbi:hypothetical protein B6I21_02070 [candidate division KSB1 bacterium 4572_119]|nr:MAG: hypothetical protein B6I21_02070 [candidate division KSB1 bacterium 4572_119]
MINFLKGNLTTKSPTRLVVDVNGVGFEINITLPCYETIGDVGSEVQVPGIGPKKAQVILSSVTAEVLFRYIIEDDLPGLTSLSGVGKKTAQRLVFDLKDKIKTRAEEVEHTEKPREEFSALEHQKAEALAALISLGFNKNNAQNSVEKVIRIAEKNISLEELIKQALRLL